MASNYGVHTNQFDMPKAPWVYNTTVVPIDANDGVDRTYVESKAQLSHRVYNNLDPQTNGSNTSFTTSVNYVAGSLLVLDEGLKVDQNNITESGPNTFTLSYAPPARLEVYFLPTGTLAAGNPNLDRIFYLEQAKPLYLPEIDNCLVLVDTTAGNISLPMPTTIDLLPWAEGLRVRFKNIGPNLLTLVPYGACKIAGVAGNYVIDSAEESGEFVFVVALVDFVLISNLFETPISEEPDMIEADNYAFTDTSTGLFVNSVDFIPTPIESQNVEFQPFIMES